MTDTIHIGLIYGSTRKGRFCDTVARWAVDEIRAQGHYIVHIIDPAESSPGSDEPSKSPTLWERMAQCDAFVVVTPEYNHGYPAALKMLIDSVGPEWHAKPVAFVSYGGISGGLRAVEQLRLVFAELHAVTIRDSVSFASAWELFDATGKLKQPERAQRSMATMLGRLRWWAVALRDARAAVPYTNA
ncbi:NADPH-dependent FMN reductase [Occallatibacter riparius]|uniref:NAD(P)H-dependent oxidoreductase n=1 Tax=Occallatibacter riparius TaxID=1002689 RepID=A0A9J7BSU2_9BACT|nr:NAD(P)H-dependent oxidoreductase [Occallatibacter riparius]UWZ83974.1 NAD(P)H-dependent oxidoreductase [Occallatibacter riparius]